MTLATFYVKDHFSDYKKCAHHIMCRRSELVSTCRVAMIQVGYYRIDMLAMVYHDSLIHCTTQNIKQNFFNLFIFSIVCTNVRCTWNDSEKDFIYKSQTHMALDITIIQLSVMSTQTMIYHQELIIVGRKRMKPSIGLWKMSA